METHIRPVQAVAYGESVSPAFLPTSPEFALKRVLAAGFDRIFQIAPCFRVEGKSNHHLSQFRMLEWYTAFQDYETLMDQTEALIKAAALLFPASEAARSFSASRWPRYSIREIFTRTFGRDLLDCNRQGMYELHRAEKLEWLPTDSWDDLFHRLWLNRIEATFPKKEPFFVYGFPASQAALSKLETLPDGWTQARRFELYFGDLELANAFEELTDANEQRERFERDMKSRQKIYGLDFPPTPIDEGFLQALEEGIPPCSGIALGVDRLIQVLAGIEKIQDTVWIEPVLIDSLPRSL
jgi:lysyl-tRNA synthetase class 2